MAVAGQHHQERGCLVISRAGKCIINARMGFEDTGMHTDGLCRLVTAVLGFAGNPLWSTLRIEGGKQLCVVDRGEFVVVICAGEEHGSGGLVMEGLHIAHVIRLTFAAELAVAVGRDEDEVAEEGHQYSARTEAGHLQASAQSATRPEFVSLHRLFLDPLLDTPNLTINWLAPLRACPGILDACIVDACRSEKVLDASSGTTPSKVWDAIMQHAATLCEGGNAGVIHPPSKRRAPDGPESLSSSWPSSSSPSSSAWCWYNPAVRGRKSLCIAIRPLPGSPSGVRLAAVAVLEDATRGTHGGGRGAAVWEGHEARSRASPGVWDALDALAEASLSVFPTADLPLLSERPNKGPQQRPGSGRRPPADPSPGPLLSVPKQQQPPSSSSSLSGPEAGWIGERGARKYRQQLSASSPVPEDGEQGLAPRPPPPRGASPGGVVDGSSSSSRPGSRSGAVSRPGSRSGRSGRGLGASLGGLAAGDMSLRLGGGGALSGSQQQHIFSEDAAAKSTRMRAQLGLNTPRKERGGGGEEDLASSAYSLVQLYEGTPRKGTPPKGVTEDGPMTLESLTCAPMAVEEGAVDEDGLMTLQSLTGAATVQASGGEGAELGGGGRGEAGAAGPSPGTELSGTLTKMHF